MSLRNLFILVVGVIITCLGVAMIWNNSHDLLYLAIGIVLVFVGIFIVAKGPNGITI